MRCDSVPSATRRVASVIRASGASTRPARNHPPTTPITSSPPSARAAGGANARTRSLRAGKTPDTVPTGSDGT
jgi:hypothetical protein